MGSQFVLAFAVVLLLFGKFCPATDGCESNTVNSAASALLAAFDSSAQDGDSRDAEQDCVDVESLINRVDAQFNLLKAQFRTLQSRAELKRSVNDAEKIYDDVYIVYSSLKLYKEIEEEATREDAQRKCQDFHPKNALTRIERQATGEFPLFMEIVMGSRYSERVFDQITSVLITETALASILAIECNKLIYPHASPKLQAVWVGTIKSSLKIIEKKIKAAKVYLRNNYNEAVKDEITLALDHIENDITLDRKTGGKYIYDQLNERYPFRAWGVMIYKHVHARATAAHMHEGTHGNWFHIDNGVHTIIVHSSDSSNANCSHFADKIRGKHLQEIIGDQAVYRDIATGSVEHLGSIVDLLRTTLKEKYQLPEPHFISVVAYRSDLSVTRDDSYHFSGHLFDPNTRKPTRTVFIGWC